MPLTNQIDKVDCGAGELLGTGSEGCVFVLDQISAIILADNSYVQTDEVNLDNLRIAQQKEEIFVINDIEKATKVDITASESTTEGTGLKSVDAEFPDEFEFEFKNKGFNFWKALRRFNSAKRYSVSFVDRNGNVLLKGTKEGLIKFLKTNMVHTGQLMTKQGTNGEMAKLRIQLSSIKEFENAKWVTEGESNLDVEELQGWNDILFTASPLAVAGTTLTVSATLIDKSHFASGLVTADFLIERNGVTVAHTTVVSNESTKSYAITIPSATAGVYTVTTKNTYGKGVVLQTATGLLFKGNVATVTVA